MGNFIFQEDSYRKRKQKEPTFGFVEDSGSNFQFPTSGKLKQSAKTNFWHIFDEKI